MPRGESKRNSSPYGQNCSEWCGDEKVFFISQHFVPDSHGFASIGFDWTPLAHGDDMGPPVDGLIEERDKLVSKPGMSIIKTSREICQRVKGVPGIGPRGRRGGASGCRGWGMGGGEGVHVT